MDEYETPDNVSIVFFLFYFTHQAEYSPKFVVAEFRKRHVIMMDEGWIQPLFVLNNYILSLLP